MGRKDTVSRRSPQGRVTANGAGNMRRIVIYNTSSVDWHDCDVRLPNNRHYRIGDLDGGDDDGVLLFRFEYDSTPAWPATNAVRVICREGMSLFPVSM